MPRPATAALTAAALTAAALITATAPSLAADGEWQPFDPGVEAVCADGSPVQYLERRADPARVVFYLEGGGACFSAETCAFDGDDTSYISSSEVTADWLAERPGIFDLDRPDNPFGEYSFVYVPYCTGDVHLGNRTTTYPTDLVVQHRGYANGVAALDYLAETYPEATQVVVAGSSAGSAPTPLYAGMVADRLPETDVLAIADSSGAYPSDPILNGWVGTLWGSMQARPDWPELADVSVYDWGIPTLFRYAAEHAPDLVLATFDYAYDETQVFYAGLVGVPADELVTLIDELDAELAAQGVEISEYVAPGSAHTILGEPAFYELEVEGVRFVDWVGQLLAGGRPADVHCRECR